MPTYKLTYFDIRGRGELIRMLFVAGNLEFEDKRIQFADWPKLKPTTPSGSLPNLEIDGKVYTQSLAIAKYVAREVKMAGKTSLEELRVDEVLHVAEDLKQALGKAHFEKDETKKKELVEKLATEGIPRYARVLEMILEENDNGYFVGDAISAADIAAFAVFEGVIAKYGEDVLKMAPKLMDNRKKVMSNPRIGNYLKNRKHTDL